MCYLGSQDIINLIYMFGYSYIYFLLVLYLKQDLKVWIIRLNTYLKMLTMMNQEKYVLDEFKDMIIGYKFCSEKLLNLILLKLIAVDI